MIHYFSSIKKCIKCDNQEDAQDNEKNNPR